MQRGDRNGSQPYLVLDRLSKTFRDGRGNRVEAVREVSLRIERGEFVTLVGPSGCGKTTTLRIISGIEMPDDGRILLEGVSVGAMSSQERAMPMVFQSYALFPHMTVFDNIAYGLRLRSMTRDAITHDVALACQMVDLVGVEHRYPGELSGGQQQRVALARALVLKPRIILFDEPLSNLDPRLRTQTRAAIRRVQQLLGITIIYVTHDQVEALSLSDRVVIMHRGRIVQVGTPRQVYHRPATPFVADFIGNANFLDGNVRAVGREAVDIHLNGKDRSVPLERCTGEIRPKDDVLVAVHPEAVGMYSSSGEETMEGTIETVAFGGPFTEYTVACGEAWIRVVQPDRHPETRLWIEGETVHLELDSEAIRVYGAGV